MAPPTNPRRLVPLTQVAQTEGYGWVTTRWLRRLIYERGLRSFKVSGRVLIDLDDIDRMVADGERIAA